MPDSKIVYLSHPHSQLEKRLLSALLADVDASLPEPLQTRAFFTSFDEIATTFLNNGLIAYATNLENTLLGVSVVYADARKYERAYETYIGVLSTHRRQGIGNRLSSMVMDICRTTGVRGIMTNCDPRNHAKIAMNLSLGYTQVCEPTELARLERVNPKWTGKAFFIKDWAPGQ